MGLDAYVYTINFTPESEVDFKLPQNIKLELFFQWRKNWEMQNVMADIYFNKGGIDETFNCAKVILDLYDLSYIEACIEEFDYEDEYDENQELERERDLNFINIAREKLKQGLTVFYDSWY